jgi:O-antigen/teichoic acid export membrane protein
MAGTVVVGIFSYLSLAVSARVLGADDFGLLGALLSVSAFASVLLRPTGFATTHMAVAALSRSGTADLRGFVGLSLTVGAVLGAASLAVFALLADRLSEILHIGEYLPLALLAPLLATAATIQMTGGLVSGAQRFSWVALANVLDAGLRAVVIGPLAISLGVAGALASYILGQLASILFSLKMLGGASLKVPPLRELVDGVRTGTTAMSLLAGIALLQSLDLVLLRWYGSPTDAGIYAACASAGNLYLTLGAPLYLPAFPRALAAHRRREPTTPILLSALAPIAVVGLAVTGSSLLLGPLVMTLAFGVGFAAAGYLLPVYLAKITMLMVVGTVGQHAIAIGRSQVVHILVPLALAGLASLAFFQPDPQSTAKVVLACASTMSAWLAAAIFFKSPEGAGRGG